MYFRQSAASVVSAVPDYFGVDDDAKSQLSGVYLPCGLSVREHRNLWPSMTFQLRCCPKKTDWEICEHDSERPMGIPGSQMKSHGIANFGFPSGSSHNDQTKRRKLYLCINSVVKMCSRSNAGKYPSRLGIDHVV
jgi:hypothetical protein